GTAATSKPRAVTMTTSFVLMCTPFSFQLASGPPSGSFPEAARCRACASRRPYYFRPVPPCLDSFRFLGRFRFGDSGPAEDINDHVVALAPRRRIQGPFCFHPRNFRGPRLGPRRGIINRECIRQCVVRCAREAFDEMQLFAGSSEIGAIREIRGIDHQRITFPMSYRIPLPQPDVLRNVGTAVGGDDAGGVVRLVKQRYVSRPLHNLQQVAFIGSWSHRTSSAVPYDATLT